MADFEATLREHSGLIRRIAQTYERDAHRAQDLEQDIALALWRAMPRFRGTSSVRTFVARIAHNRAVSHVAKEVRRGTTAIEPSLPDRGPSVEESVGASDERTRLLHAVRSLPLGSRQVVALWLEGFSPVEIGEAFGIAPNAVAARLSRARDRLRTLLAPKDGIHAR
jgi:RNA polymerase sigma factor (sigma-70 family)